MTRRKAIPIIKPPVTWILVADARQAQIYMRQKIERQVPRIGNYRRNPFEEIIAHAPVPVDGMTWEAESADEYETGRNQTGMVFESTGSARSMSEPHIEVRDEIRNHFARAIANRMIHEYEEKSFDRLVLIAPAKMLGEIKKHLDAKTLKSIAAEMPKDLTHYEGEALAKHLESIG